MFFKTICAPFPMHAAMLNLAIKKHCLERKGDIGHVCRFYYNRFSFINRFTIVEKVNCHLLGFSDRNVAFFMVS